MKSIQIQATNKINLSGKLMDVTFGDGKLSDGRPYQRATVTVRVTQTYGGKEETSDIQVGMFLGKLHAFLQHGRADPWRCKDYCHSNQQQQHNPQDNTYGDAGYFPNKTFSFHALSFHSDKCTKKEWI